MSAQLDAQLRRELRDIVELVTQARALARERRFARAAKRCAAAVERARALAALGDNSVIVARLESEHAQILRSLVRARLLTPTEPLPATGNDMDTRVAAEQALEQLLAAVTTMRYRRVAGTLLRGTCRAAEVAYVLAELDAEIAAGYIAAKDAQVGRAEAVGENGIAYVGTAALAALELDLQPEAQTLLSGSQVLGSSALGVLAMYVRETLDLVDALMSGGVPPGLINFARNCESVIADVWERVCAHCHDRSQAGGTLARASRVLVEELKPLCDAWAVQRRTPALQRLLSPDAWAFYARTKSDADARRRSFLEGQRKRSCAHCGATEPVRGDFQACGRCRRAFYCSREHQRAHWRAGHKAACCDAASGSQAAD